MGNLRIESIEVVDSLTINVLFTNTLKSTLSVANFEIQSNLETIQNPEIYSIRVNNKTRI